MGKQRFAPAIYIILSKTKNPINVIKFRFLLSEETYIVIWLEYNANLLSDFRISNPFIRDCLLLL